MGRIFTKQEGNQRHRLSHKIGRLTSQLNDAIHEAIEEGVVPDVSVSMTAGTISPQPIVDVAFFRTHDSIQDE